MLALFIFSIMILIFSKHYFAINRLADINMTSHRIGATAKNKMEEIKSGYIYIDDNRYSILDLDKSVEFKEQDYNISISISPLQGHENIDRVNLEIENGNVYYNLVRYINLSKIKTGD